MSYELILASEPRWIERYIDTVDPLVTGPGQAVYGAFIPGNGVPDEDTVWTEIEWSYFPSRRTRDGYRSRIRIDLGGYFPMPTPGHYRVWARSEGVSNSAGQLTIVSSAENIRTLQDHLSDPSDAHDASAIGGIEELIKAHLPPGGGGGDGLWQQIDASGDPEDDMIAPVDGVTGVSLADLKLFYRDAGDLNHSMGWGIGKGIDGPVLNGFTGGGFAVGDANDGTDELVAEWDEGGLKSLGERVAVESDVSGLVGELGNKAAQTDLETLEGTVGTKVTSAEVGVLITAAVDALVDGAPGAVDTFIEVAALLADHDDEFAALLMALNLKIDATAVAANYQPLNAVLTALSALSTTTYGRSLLTMADAAALRTAAGLGTLATLSGITNTQVADGALDPAKISGLVPALGTKVVTVLVSGYDVDLTTGEKIGIPIDATLNGKTLTTVTARVHTVSSSGLPTVQFIRTRAGSPTNMLSTALTIDASERSSTTAATAAVIGTGSVQTDDEVVVSVTTAGTGVRGLSVTLVFT